MMYLNPNQKRGGLLYSGTKCIRTTCIMIETYKVRKQKQNLLLVYKSDKQSVCQCLLVALTWLPIGCIMCNLIL